VINLIYLGPTVMVAILCGDLGAKIVRTGAPPA
jgi:hypothetical protein